MVGSLERVAYLHRRDREPNKPDSSGNGLARGASKPPKRGNLLPIGATHRSQILIAFGGVRPIQAAALRARDLRGRSRREEKKAGVPSAAVDGWEVIAIET